MTSEGGPDGGGLDSPATALGAGSAETFRVEYVPTSPDQRFGMFQLHVGGVSIGDGTTTALLPHYDDLCRLCALAARPSLLPRERLILGDTFDHLDMFIEMTELDVLLTFTTRPEWGEPPSWAPPVGKWIRLRTSRSKVVNTWRHAEPQFRLLLGR